MLEGISSFFDSLFGTTGPLANLLDFLKMWLGIANQGDTSLVSILGRFVPNTILGVVALYLTINFVIHMYQIVKP